MFVKNNVNKILVNYDANGFANEMFWNSNKLQITSGSPERHEASFQETYQDRIVADYSIAVYDGSEYKEILQRLSDPNAGDFFTSFQYPCAEQDSAYLILGENISMDLHGYCLSAK